MRTYLHIIGMYSKRSELEIRVRMAVLCTPNQSFEPRKSDMVSEKVPFQVPVPRYSYKVVSGHVTFKWSSVYYYNLRMDCGSQDYS